MNRIAVTAISPLKLFDDWSHTACTMLPPSARGDAVNVMKPRGCNASASTIVSVTEFGVESLAIIDEWLLRVLNVSSAQRAVTRGWRTGVGWTHRMT